MMSIYLPSTLSLLLITIENLFQLVTIKKFLSGNSDYLSSSNTVPLYFSQFIFLIKLLNFMKVAEPDMHAVT
jgi:hypothetical protein